MTNTTHYQPTIIEKILGSLYKWWFMIGYYFRLRTTYRIDNFLFALGNILTLSGTILTWYVASGAVLDNDFKNKLTYFIIGTFFYSFINIWPSFYGLHIKRGNHSGILLTPTGFFQYIYSQYAGLALFQNSNVIILLMLTSPAWITLVERPSNIVNIVFMMMLIPVSGAIMFMVEIMIALAAFFITEMNGLTLNYGFVSSILSGKLFPLGLLIPLFWVNMANPFAFLFYHPMQIYLGNYSTPQILSVLTVGLLWVVGLYFIGQLVFKSGLRKNESIGM